MKHAICKFLSTSLALVLCLCISSSPVADAASPVAVNPQTVAVS